jgi:hypothetical protein
VTVFIRPELMLVRRMAACDSCGAVAVLTLAPGWRRFSAGTGVKHHCPRCVEFNEHVRGGLVYKIDPAMAVTYDD